MKLSKASAVASVAMLDEPVRRGLYDYVSQRESVGRDEAAAALGISRVLAAFHLDKLVKGGLLTVSYRRLTGRSGPGAGRPAKLYTRAHGDIAVSLPARHYELPAEAFASGLEALAVTVGADTVNEAVNAPARELGRREGASVRRTLRSSSARRAREALVRHLADDGFEPAVDQQTGAVTLGNCPYRVLSEAHRELTCGMNLAWAEGLIEAARTTNLEARLDFQPGRCCVVFAPPAASA